MRDQFAKRRADRPEWQRILDRRFAVQRVDRHDYHGWVTCLWIDRVAEPLTVSPNGEPVCIVDAGFRWIQHFPDGRAHTITTMLDEVGLPVQAYVDIAAGLGSDPDGVPWWQDLYLDIVVLGSGTTIVLDEEELDQALTEGTITPAQHAAAWTEARTVLGEIDRDPGGLFRRAIYDSGPLQ